MEQLLRDLAVARIGATHNQYRGPGGAERLANLRHYLDQRRDAEVVALGEAAGYQGMRWSGIAFTSERDLLRWGSPFRITSDRPRGWSEPSGTIVHRVLDILQPALVVAVGRVAEGVLGDRARYVRHPANGGAAAFAAGLSRELAELDAARARPQ